MLLIGSQALKVRAPTLLQREPRDIDVIASWDEYEAFERQHRSFFREKYPTDQGKKMILKRPGIIMEVEIAWSDSPAAKLIEQVHTSSDVLFTFVREPEAFGINLGALPIPNLDVLYALKMSHRYLKDSPHFLKTMMDIRRMRTLGAKIPDHLQDWYKLRENETYWYKHPNLNQDKMGFFNGDGVKYVYDHDSIHVAVAHGKEPAYTLYMKDGAQVACDKEKWNALPDLTKLQGVAEEAYVLALERSQIPHPGVLTPRASFEKALMKVCTSITSGWFREFAWESYFEVMRLYDDTYVDRFWKAVQNGTVKKL